MLKVILASVVLLLTGTNALGRQADLINNVLAHDHISLNGSWQAIIDPYLRLSGPNSFNRYYYRSAVSE